MSRKPPKPVKAPKDTTYPGVTDTKPRWFWKTCYFCKDRIREEDMWAYHTPFSLHVPIANLFIAKHACTVCCPTRRAFWERLFPASAFSHQTQPILSGQYTTGPRLPRRPRLTPPETETKEEEPLQPPTQRSRFKGLIEE